VRRYVVDETGAIIRMIIPAGEAGAGTYLVNWDSHGDAIALWRVEANGTVTLANSFTYSTWGLPSTTTHNGIGDLQFRFLYVGRFGVQWDDLHGLGLHFMHARHYRPLLGRFLEPDPRGLETNLYRYSANSPVTLSDPTGLYPPPPDRLDQVSPEERAECKRDLVACAKMYVAALFAEDIAQAQFPNHVGDLDRRDALRHCVWQCLGTYYVGAASAERFAVAHEEGNPSRPIARRMDEWNNHVGQALGTQMRREWFVINAELTSAWLCKGALENGMLRIVRLRRTGAALQPS
jgi:RHS repeat-associated protein